MKRVQEVDEFVGIAIRKRRQKINMSQATLAAAVGITPQQCAKYEKGINRITCGRLAKIAARLGVPVGALFPPVPKSDTPEATLPASLRNLDAGVLRPIRNLVRSVAKLDADHASANVRWRATSD